MEHSQIILDIIKNKNISAYKISKETGISESLFSKWKKNPTSEISSINLARIADYLDCSVDYLLGRTDVPEVNHGDNYSQIPHYAQSAASTGRELGKSQSPDDVVEITALQEYEKNK